MVAQPASPKIYIAINDLLVYASAISQPTGIQRVASGLAAALIQTAGATPVLLTQDGARLATLPNADPGSAAPSGLGYLIREPLLRILARLPRRVQEAVRSGARSLLAQRAAGSGGTLVSMNRGDWILLLGAPWIAPRMASSALAVSEQSGARIGLLVHDLLPATEPRWFADAQGRAAKLDVESLIAQASQLFAVSPEVAAELASRYEKRAVVILPAEPQLHNTALPTTRGEYVLSVGTLHPRKNLEALVEIWARCPDAPRLIFAGRRHPQDGALFHAITNGGSARAKIELRHDVDDAALGRLYAGARFLVLPSRAEGWGLPVREAFAAGRPAIATDAVPAALGSPFAQIVPAGDTVALEAAIRSWWESETPELLAARISREFTPRTWHDSAADVLSALTRASA